MKEILLKIAQIKKISLLDRISLNFMIKINA